MYIYIPMYGVCAFQCGLRDRYFSTSASAIRVGSVGRRKGTRARQTRAGREGQRRGSRRALLSEAATLADRKLTCGRVTIAEIWREREREMGEKVKEGKIVFSLVENASDEHRDSLGGRGL